MPIPSPFEPRTAPLCRSWRWKDWAGYRAVASYEPTHEREYNAFRQAAGLIDVSPLYKYEVRGAEAAEFLAHVMVRDIRKLGIGRIVYCCWCDDRGKVVDDGTVARLADEHYRVTAAEPSLRWFSVLARGFDVTVEDSSRSIAALALQGPTSREILSQVCDLDLEGLRFFGAGRTELEGLDAWVTRTGYTGDLGYEIWVPCDQAVRLWDVLMEAGRDYGIQAAGLDALDVTRIEAGFIMLHVDYFSAPRVMLESRKSTPYELGLGWTVHLDRGPFVGRAAIEAEKSRGPAWRLVGLEADWEELERLYEGYGLPPDLPAHASREPLPVYSAGRQIGQVTSHTWSPLLKKSIALASVRADHAQEGTRLEMEHTVEFERRTVTAKVVKTPFFDPPRKKGTLRAKEPSDT